MKKHLQKKIQKASVERKLVWSSSLFLLLLFGFYGYFVNATIVNVVERKNLEAEHERVSSDISNLEFQYISLNADLNVERASELGLREVENPQYAKRASDRVLTLAQ